MKCYSLKNTLWVQHDLLSMSAANTSFRLVDRHEIQILIDLEYVHQIQIHLEVAVEEEVFLSFTEVTKAQSNNT